MVPGGRELLTSHCAWFPGSRSLRGGLSGALCWDRAAGQRQGSCCGGAGVIRNQSRVSRKLRGPGLGAEGGLVPGDSFL